MNIVGPDARLVLADRGLLRMYGFPDHLGAPGTPLADFVHARLQRADFHPHEDPSRATEALIVARVAQIMTAPIGRFQETRPGGTASSRAEGY